MDNKKKIGIVSLYYGNNNYGGVLQAYALCKKLNNLNFDAEQICFITESSMKEIQMLKKSVVMRTKKIISNIIHYKKNKRNKILTKFRENCILHSDIVYTKDSIDQVNKIYDCFITGSDQVWNLNWLETTYFLDFVDNHKKISYAASFGMEQFDEKQIEFLKNNLDTFDSISVREKSIVSLLESIINKQICSVLDPTLLLKKSEWDEICSSKLVNEDYMFCYFLGNRDDLRIAATKYAEKYNLKIVTFSELVWKNKKVDKDFGDIRVYDASPQDFISYIKYAKCVMTDSFHVTVFSNIYSKNFYVFHRNENKTMSSRVYDLLQLFHNEERLCENLQDVFTKKFNEVVRDVNIENEINQSIKFLIDSIG